MTGSDSPRFVQATTTSLRIVELIREQEGATLTEIADELDIGYSTAHNHLATLCEEEWIVESNSEYQIGLKFLHYGTYARRRTPLFDVARRHVNELAEKTNFEVEFLVEEYGRLVSIADIVRDAGGYGHLDDNPWQDPGEFYYMHNTACGKVILAELPEERVEEILDKWGMPAETQYSVTDRETLYDQLHTIREQGYAEIHQEVIEGFANVATTVNYPDGSVFGAMSVGWPTYLYEDGVEIGIVDDLLETKSELETEVTDVLEG